MAWRNPFLFEIIFNTTDSTLVKNVILEYTTVNGEVDYLKAEYDGTTGHWMCSANLQNDAVCNVDVIYTDKHELLIDRETLNLTASTMDVIKQALLDMRAATEAELDAILKETDVAKQKLLLDEFFTGCGIDPGTPYETDVRTWEEINADIQALLAQDGDLTVEALDGQNLYNADMGDNIKISHTTGITAEQLLEEGYEAYGTTDGGSIYQLATEGKIVIVDFDNDLKIEYLLDEETQAKVRGMMRRVASNNAKKVMGEFVTNVNNAVLFLQVCIDGIVDAVGKFGRLLSGPRIAEYAKRLAELRSHVAAYQQAGKTLGQAPPELIADMLKVRDNKNFWTSVDDLFQNLAKKGPNPEDAITVFANAPLGKGSKMIQSAIKEAQKINWSAVGKFFAWTTIINDGVDAINKETELLKVWDEIPMPCPNKQADAERLNEDIGTFPFGFFWLSTAYFITTLGADAYTISSMGASIPGAPASFGITLSGIVATGLKILLSMEYSKTFDQEVKWWRDEIDLLQCKAGDNEKWKRKVREDYRSGKLKPFRNVRVAIAPSGYVYEAVADNRVENAKATIYFKQTGEDEYGDLHDEVVKWNAEEFRQENPLFTDAEGKYAWDVPQGLWQVKVEKAGYETAYSDWLPVPPPQLDINIPLVRNTLPDVQSARAFEDGVEVTFNEYMRPQSLTAERLTLMQDGQLLPCRIEQQNLSLSYDKKDAYVSRVKVRTESPLASGSKVQLTVHRQVEAYNGLQMQKDYQQEFTVVREVYAIGADSIVEVAKGAERVITVRAFPAEAAQGMKVTAQSVISTIATVTGEATFDENGEARLTINGKVGGQTMLLLTLDNSKVTARSVIIVEDPALLPVYAPAASLVSGVSVKEGETVALSCDTEGAVIWYTTDGSCPCDENGTRVKYTEPIVITQPLTIRAYAVKGDAASRVASFSYGIFDPSGIQSPSAGGQEGQEGQKVLRQAKRQSRAQEGQRPWYSVGGVRLDKKPLKKGVYISGRRKVAVK